MNKSIITTGHLRGEQQITHRQTSSPDSALGHKEPFCPSGLTSVQAESKVKDEDFCPFRESALTQQHKPELIKRI